MSEQEPLQPRVKGFLDAEISTAWFTNNLAKISQSEREQYVRMLRTQVQDSLAERKVLQARAANIAKEQKDLKHADEVVQDQKRRSMLGRLVHDAKHEGLEALLSKVESAIWGTSV